MIVAEDVPVSVTFRTWSKSVSRDRVAARSGETVLHDALDEEGLEFDLLLVQVTVLFGFISAKDWKIQLDKQFFNSLDQFVNKDLKNLKVLI